MNTMPRKKAPAAHKGKTWSTHDIELARTADLAAILARKGYQTTHLPNGAVLLHGFRGLLVHTSRWSWKCQNLWGNALDFFTIVEGKTFTQAMEIVAANSTENDEPPEDDNDFL